MANEKFSSHDSVPMELYYFYTEDLTEIYRYANVESPFTIPFYGTFEPANFERNDIAQSGDDFLFDLEIQADIDCEFVKLNKARIGKKQLFLKVFSYQRTQPLQRIYLLFSGLVTEIAISGLEATIKAVLYLKNFTNPVLRRKAQRLCPYALYSDDCGVSMTAFTFIGSVSGFGDSMRDIVSPIFGASGRCHLGTLFNTRTSEHRLISEHSINNQVKIIRPFLEIYPADEIKLILSCNKLWSVCRDRFNNLHRFGGFQYMSPDELYSYDKVVRYQ